MNCPCVVLFLYSRLWCHDQCTVLSMFPFHLIHFILVFILIRWIKWFYSASNVIRIIFYFNFFYPLNLYICLILKISRNYIRVHWWPKVKCHFLFSFLCLPFYTFFTTFCTQRLKLYCDRHSLQIFLLVIAFILLTKPNVSYLTFHISLCSTKYNQAGAPFALNRTRAFILKGLRRFHLWGLSGWNIIRGLLRARLH